MCDCKIKVNKILAPHNTTLECNMLNPSDIIIETVKIDTKKRGKKSFMFANFCPWCGEKLPRGEWHDSLTPAAPLSEGQDSRTRMKQESPLKPDSAKKEGGDYE